MRIFGFHVPLMSLALLAAVAIVGVIAPHLGFHLSNEAALGFAFIGATGSWPTLIDAASRTAPDGEITPYIAEMLSTSRGKKPTR